MVRKIGTLALLACLGTAPAAHAAEHIVAIVGNAYFPTVTYVLPGDTVRFVNETGSSQRIYSKNQGGNGSWKAPVSLNRVTIRPDGTYQEFEYVNGQIISDDDESFVLTVVNNLQFAFTDRSNYWDGGKYGTIKWGPAPND